MTPGGEGAGVVTAIGEGVTGVQVGDRVCFTGTPAAYAEQVLTNRRPAGPHPQRRHRRDGLRGPSCRDSRPTRWPTGCIT